ncbi:MAG: hypothetical protein RB191_00905 [Terriglobia bacterium]|nr:hypothetical protein [Terriglobia bacterium]
MGKASREKWLRRIEDAVRSTQSKPSKFQAHMPWLAPMLLAVVAAIAGGWGLDMIPFFLLIGLLFATCLLALWWLSERGKHRKVRIAGTVVLVLIASIASWWNYTYNRPRFVISIEQGFTGGSDNTPLLGFRLYVTNIGRQPTYANKWELRLTTSDKVYQGRQDFDLAVPKALAASAESSIADSTFASGEPVRGWVFFYLPDMSHATMMNFMGCGAKQDAKIIVSLWDEKIGRQWQTERSSLDLVRSGCGVLPK